MAKKPQRFHYDCLARLNSLFLHILFLQLVWSPCWLLGEHQILVKRGWTGLVITPWAWVSFLPVILHFSGNIGDESLCTEVPLVRRHRFPLLCLFDNCLQLRSHQSLVTVDLLDTFLNILKLFMALERDFTKSLWQRMDGVRRERSMANQLHRSWWQVERGGWSEIFSKWMALEVMLCFSDWYSCCPGCKYPHLVYFYICQRGSVSWQLTCGNAVEMQL